MKNCLIVVVLLPMACSCNPITKSITDDVEQILTDEAVSVEINRAALSNNANVEVNIKITNKDAFSSKN